MRITVIGAGAIGSAIAQELAARDDVAQVQVCDRQARSLQRLHEHTDRTDLRSFQVDARDLGVLSSILRGSDCVVSCVPPEQNTDMAALCLELGIHFCDLGGSEEGVQQELALAEKARKKSIWIVPNCGLAPGLVNVLCLRGLAAFDAARAAHLRVGDVPLHPEPPFRFRISWSAEKILDDYTNPVQCIREGAVVETQPLEHEEHICFEPPFGEMEAFSTQGGLSTLAEALSGRLETLDHKTIRWPGHAHQMRFLLGLGFAERRKIDVRTHLTYRDVLVRRMRQRLGGPHADAVLLRVLIQGEKDGRPQTLTYEMIDRFDEAEHLTAMERCASVPAATVAVMLAEGSIPGGGAAPPENVVPHEEYCERLLARGLPLTTTWRDGHIGVAERARRDAAA